MDDSGKRVFEQSLPRTESSRLVAGGGRFLDSLKLGQVLHLAVVRSNIARATLESIETNTASAMPGVVAVITAKDLNEFIAEMPVTRLENFADHVSRPQPPLVERHIRYHGEPLAIVVAETLSEAEDAAEFVVVNIVEPAGEAKDLSKKFASEDIGSEFEIGKIKPEERGQISLKAEFSFARQSGVTLEPRGIVASYDNMTEEITVWQSHQSPHLVQGILSRILGMPENRVHVKVGDVGGGFGVKLHLYADEIAAVLVSRLLAQPVKYVVTRIESFQSDVQAREFDAVASISFLENGEICGMEADFKNAIGAYSIFPRSSIGDSIQAATQLGAPYKIKWMKSKAQTFWQHKAPSGAIRGVGMPIPCTITEQLMDMAARYLSHDPAKFRLQHYHADNDYPLKTLGGIYMDKLSLKESLELLLEKMSYDELRLEQKRLRSKGMLRGIGIATFVEQTALGPELYGGTGIPITSIEECRIRLEADGSIRVETGATDQGQGTLTGIRQIVAEILGVAFSNVQISGGGSFGARGGGAWASRGLSLAGEAAALAAGDLRNNILELAGSLLQSLPSQLELSHGVIIESDVEKISLRELSKMVWYQPYNLPKGAADLTSVSRCFTLEGRPHLMANGVQGSVVEIDIDTGKVKPLEHWVVEDCGNIINRRLVDGQVIGGVAQGIGAALSENCVYDESGQLLTGSFQDYAVSRADDLPPIQVYHVTTPQEGTKLGIKGVGEAGTIGSPAALWGAVNDAIAHLGARVNSQPITSESVLNAILNGE